MWSCMHIHYMNNCGSQVGRQSVQTELVTPRQRVCWLCRVGDKREFSNQLSWLQESNPKHTLCSRTSRNRQRIHVPSKQVCNRQRARSIGTERASTHSYQPNRCNPQGNNWEMVTDSRSSLSGGQWWYWERALLSTVCISGRCSPETSNADQARWTSSVHTGWYLSTQRISGCWEWNVFTDASGRVRCGALWFDQWILNQYKWWDNYARQAISQKEFLAVVLAFAVWDKEWENQVILIHYDNKVAVQVVNSGYSKEPNNNASAEMHIFLKSPFSFGD